ncbi:hypothetical protein Barb7_03178 [Bacteroidales bacterium Barb7]|nr:hypothetical protein Barb7_03178 [Bacteroidales bacterium Barb7]
MKLPVIDHSGEDGCHQYIKYGTDKKGYKDASWHVFLRIARFLSGGRKGIETEIGVKDHTRAAKYPAPAVSPVLAGVFGDIGMPVGSVDIGHAEPDEKEYHGYLDNHDDIVDKSRLLDASEKEGRHKGDNKHGGEINQTARQHPLPVRQMLEGGLCELCRKPDAPPVQQAQHISRPADGNA